MTKKTAPYGTWPSPITPESLVEHAVRLSHLSICGDRAYWIESRPSEAGRDVLVAARPGEAPAEVLPGDCWVRTQVHEYGGRCYAAFRDPSGEDRVVFSDWRDQRLWSRTDGTPPVPLTPEPERPRAERFADPVVSPDGEWVVCVHEHHGADGEVVNELVSVTLNGPTGLTPTVIARGHDFYSAPRLSPDGNRLAWISWDHPNMPWDSSELWVATVTSGVQLGSPSLVAGGAGESITQPRWSPDGVLHYVSDRSGWWNLYDEWGEALCEMEAEFGQPDWVFGNCTYGFGESGEVIAAWSTVGRRHIGLVRDGRVEPVELPFSSYDYVTPAGGSVLAVVASAVHPPLVARLDLVTASYVELRRSRELTIDGDHISRPAHVEFPTSGGSSAHALFYPPTHATYEGPRGEGPPLVVIIHGGPTSSTSEVFNLAIQYWTSRGFAVADVDYRGSSGYGREYRRLLDGTWGVADVEDCAAVVAWLGGQGLVDSHRAVIRGGSAGGFTTLAALAFTDAFSAGASLFGVADLRLLATETHKFESRYLDGLVGPWPEAADAYRARSPIHHVEKIDRPLILFQGLEDKVVPPAQSELMYDALRSRGVPVAYKAFEGEQHGFRKADTIIAVATYELAFYGRVLGFEPDGTKGAEGLLIENEEKLSPPREA